MSRTSSGVIWRRSARGCTVMPGAPAPMHVSTASTTLGSRPPRELRKVAILLTLTESWIMDHEESGSESKKQESGSDGVRGSLPLLPDFLTSQVLSQIHLDDVYDVLSP